MRGGASAVSAGDGDVVLRIPAVGRCGWTIWGAWDAQPASHARLAGWHPHAHAADGTTDDEQPQLRLRLARHRLGLRWQCLGAAPRAEGLLRRRAGVWQALRRRWLRALGLGRAPLLLVAAARVARHAAHECLQGHGDPQWRRGRWGQPRLQRRPLSPSGELLQRPSVGRARGLGEGARPALRRDRTDARGLRLRARDASRSSAARDRRRRRLRGDVRHFARGGFPG